MIADLRENGRVERGWLGVAIQPVGPEIAETLGLSEDEGALIAQVVPGSPAEAGGLEPGDVIYSIDGAVMETPKDVSKAVAALKAGQTAQFNLWRDGDRQAIDVEIGAYPEERQSAALSVPVDDGVLDGLGLALAESPEGVVIRAVKPASQAAEKGLRPGDIIVEVAGEPVEHLLDVRNDIANAKEQDRKSVLLLVRSDAGQRFVALRLQET